MLRWVKAVVGIVFVVFGVLWILQGVNLLQGSFMSGQSMWLVIGIVVALLGAWLLLSLRPGGGRLRVGYSLPPAGQVCRARPLLTAIAPQGVEICAVSRLPLPRSLPGHRWPGASPELSSTPTAYRAPSNVTSGYPT